jgi:ASC-1-like (ASCH) protein
MDHVAILQKAKVSTGENLLRDILEGTKIIESRWYVNKVSPWDKIKSGDIVYFKEAGCPVTARADVNKVIQYENLDQKTIVDIINKYGKDIAPHTTLKDFLEWGREQTKKRFCILVFIENVKKIEPFDVDKKGYGISSAWMAVGDISRVRVSA